MGPVGCVDLPWRSSSPIVGRYSREDSLTDRGFATAKFYLFHQRIQELGSAIHEYTAGASRK